MAKKKHKQQKRKTNGSALKSGQKTNWEAEARSVFHDKIKRYARDRVEIPDVYEGMDYEPQMLKRRIAAIAASVQDIKERFALICPERPTVFSIEEDWVEVNSYPNPSYDYEEQNAFTLLGAAIWILDQLRELDLISEASLHLPSDQEILGLEMPPVYDLCHSESMLRSMLSVLQNRNADCVGINPGKKDSEAQIKRVFMDRYTVENKHHQDVPSRNRFEAILSLIPQKAIQSAVDTYTEKYWDFLERYFRSRNLFAQEEYELTKDTNHFDSRAEEMTQKLERIKEGTKQRWEQGRIFTDMQGAVSIPVMPESEYMKLLKEAHEMEAIECRLTDRREDLYYRLTSFWCEVGNFNAYSLDRLSDRFDDELIEIWEGFEILDPYEMSFAFLYLLDTGSDLPWLYFPGMSLNQCIAETLPWPRIKHHYYPDGIWHHRDMETGRVVPGPKEVQFPKRVKVPELENWYRFQFDEHNVREDEDRRRYSLAHIMYEITGCIMPRNLDRYLPALMTLDRCGINGKRTIHPLLYCMTLLGEAKHQSNLIAPDTWIDENESEDMSEAPVSEDTSVEALNAKIAELQAEVKRLKRVSYEAGREVLEEKKRYELLRQETANTAQELTDLRDLVFHQQENLYLDSEPDCWITFPYHTQNRIVVFGGHETWSREMRPKLPDVRFVDRTMVPNADMIRRADVVWIQTNAISHGYYYKIIDEVRKYDVRVRYFSYASAQKCAEQIVADEKAMNK